MFPKRKRKFTETRIGIMFVFLRFFNSHRKFLANCTNELPLTCTTLFRIFTDRKYFHEKTGHLIHVHEKLTTVAANDRNLFFFEKMPCNHAIDVRVMSKVGDGIWISKQEKEQLEFTKWMCKPLFVVLCSRICVPERYN